MEKTYKEADIVVYTTPCCHWCQLVKKFLKEQNVSFGEKDVRSNSGARAEMIVKSGQIAVPVIDIGRKIIVGFDANEINTALKNQFVITHS